jgi:ribosomal protein S18 acetylase RimI-like enzyme
MSQLRIVEADLGLPEHQQAVLEMVDAYARDAFGNGHPLPADVRQSLIPGLREHPTTLILLAYQLEQPIGVAVCFLGFSTFAARPLINIHDLSVLPAYRSQGIGQQLLRAVEQKARELNCCKLTLEVHENNRRAQRIYQQAGFQQAGHQPEAGGSLCMSKVLN